MKCVAVPEVVLVKPGVGVSGSPVEQYLAFKNPPTLVSVRFQD